MNDNKLEIVATIRRHNTTWDVLLAGTDESSWKIERYGESVVFFSKNKNIVYSAIDDLYSRVSSIIELDTNISHNSTLLSTSDVLDPLSIENIAVMSGFDHPNNLNVDTPTCHTSSYVISELENRVAYLEHEISNINKLLNSYLENNTLDMFRLRIISSMAEISWINLLCEEFDKDYFIRLCIFLHKEFVDYNVYPPIEDIFTAYNVCPLHSIRVVVLGQDPYHGINQAHGLSFSVLPNKKIPPSLMNIYKELRNEYPSFKIPKDGNLIKWSRQGVFLLNTTLTVREKSPKSHAKRGWETFTDRTIEIISQSKTNTVFLLWGRHAQSKEHLIDKDNNCIIKTPHPSPLSASRGFFGSGCFIRTNEYLESVGLTPIDWDL